MFFKSICFPRNQMKPHHRLHKKEIEFKLLTQPWFLCSHIFSELTELHQSHQPKHAGVGRFGPFWLYREIAAGSFGSVYEASFCCTVYPRVALKVMDTLKPPFSPILLSKEVHILRLLHHPNVIQFYDIIHHGQYYVLLTEFSQGKDLLSWIKPSKNVASMRPSLSSLSLVEKIIVFQKLLKAVEYLLETKIIHRDLKLENVLYDRRTHAVKLCDFGFATLIKRPEQFLHTKCGSTYYVSPEVLKGRYQGESSSIWSLGVILYVLVCERFPFNGATDQEVFQSILHGSFKACEVGDLEISGRGNSPRLLFFFNHLLNRMFHKNPSQRITLQEVVQHPFLSIFAEISSSLSDSALVVKPSSIWKRKMAPPLRRSQSESLPFTNRKKNRFPPLMPSFSFSLCNPYYPLRRKSCHFQFLLSLWLLSVPNPRIQNRSQDLYFYSFLINLDNRIEAKLYNQLLQHFYRTRKKLMLLLQHKMKCPLCEFPDSTQEWVDIMEQRIQNGQKEAEAKNMCLIL